MSVLHVAVALHLHSFDWSSAFGVMEHHAAASCWHFEKEWVRMF